MNSTQKFRRTPKGVLTNLYSKMKYRNIKKGFGELPFTLQELHKNFLNDKKYIELFNQWEISGYKTSLKPSFDRINPNIGYFMQNITIKSWQDNRKKG